MALRATSRKRYSQSTCGKLAIDPAGIPLLRLDLSTVPVFALCVGPPRSRVFHSFVSTMSRTMLQCRCHLTRTQSVIDPLPSLSLSLQPSTIVSKGKRVCIEINGREREFFIGACHGVFQKVWSSRGGGDVCLSHG